MLQIAIRVTKLQVHGISCKGRETNCSGTSLKDMLKEYKTKRMFVLEIIPLYYELPPLEGKIITTSIKYGPQRLEQTLSLKI